MLGIHDLEGLMLAGCGRRGSAGVGRVKLVTRFALALASPSTALASYSRTASLRPIWARLRFTPSALLV